MAFCSNCGKEVGLTTKFCSDCGASVHASSSSAPLATPMKLVIQQEPTKPQPKPTKAWYLVPFFLNILGGIIGYFAVKNEDRQMANKLLIFGVVMFALIVVFYALVMFSALMVLSSI